MAGSDLVVRAGAADRRVDELRARLMLARLHTRASVTTLKSQITQRADWRTWYQDYPLECLAAAFFAGFLLVRRR